MTTRGLSAQTQTAIAAERVVATTAVALDFPAGIVRWNASPADIIIDGDAFYGLGMLGSITSPEEGIELRSYGLTVGLSGIPRDAIALALGQAYQNRPATVWRVHLDSTTWAVVDSPVVIFRGRMDQLDISVGETADVRVKLENRLTDWSRAKIRRYTDQEQRQRNSSDGSFRFLSATTEKELLWPGRQDPVIK